MCIRDRDTRKIEEKRKRRQKLTVTDDFKGRNSSERIKSGTEGRVQMLSLGPDEAVDNECPRVIIKCSRFRRSSRHCLCAPIILHRY